MQNTKALCFPVARLSVRQFVFGPQTAISRDAISVNLVDEFQ